MTPADDAVDTAGTRHPNPAGDRRLDTAGGRGTQTLPAALRVAAERWPDAPAVIDDEVSLTFSQLLAEVRRTAAGYVEAGLEPGGRVGVWAPNSLQWVIAGLAVSYAGGVLIPLNSRYTAHEVADILARSSAQLVVVHDGFLGKSQLQSLRDLPDANADGLTSHSAAKPTGHPLPALPLVRAVIRIRDGADAMSFEGVFDLTAVGHDLAPDALQAADSRADEVRPETVADIMFTSGTTGRPKGVMSSHDQTIGCSAAWARVGGIDEDDEYLVVAPFFHTFGYKTGVVVMLLTGCTIYPMAAFDVDRVMRLVHQRRITVLPGAPTIFSSILASPTRHEHDLSSLRLAVTGAAMVPVVLIERMLGELDIETVLTAFGQTEAVVATMCRPGDPPLTIANTCGRVVEGMEARIAEETGELLLRGDFVMLGYLDDEEATAEAIEPDGWLHTGDVATMDEHGNVTITDRLKDMYISGGFNVYPAEVEQTLLRHPAVADCAVVGVPDDRMGEVGVAYVVPKPGNQPQEQELLEFASERLANFKRPRHVELSTSLPRNLAGKVLKNELRDSAAGLGRDRA